MYSYPYVERVYIVGIYLLESKYSNSYLRISGIVMESARLPQVLCAPFASRLLYKVLIYSFSHTSGRYL